MHSYGINDNGSRCGLHGVAHNLLRRRVSIELAPEKSCWKHPIVCVACLLNFCTQRASCHSFGLGSRPSDQLCHLEPHPCFRSQRGRSHSGCPKKSQHHIVVFDIRHKFFCFLAEGWLSTLLHIGVQSVILSMVCATSPADKRPSEVTILRPPLWHRFQCSRMTVGQSRQCHLLSRELVGRRTKPTRCVFHFPQRHLSRRECLSLSKVLMKLKTSNGRVCWRPSSVRAKSIRSLRNVQC